MKNQWRALDEKVKTWLDAGKYVSWSGEMVDDQTPQGADTVEVTSTPAGAANSGASLLELQLPGILSEAELMAEVDLDEVLVMVGKTRKQTGPARVRHHLS